MKARLSLVVSASIGTLAAMVACAASDSGTGTPAGGGGGPFGGGGSGNVGATGGTGGTGAVGGSVNGGGGTPGGGGASGSGATTGGGGSGGTPPGGGGAAGSGGTSGSGGDAGICKTPTTLHPPNLDAGTSTIYCPFSAVDGGKNDYCDYTKEHCCEPGSGTAACTAKATACASSDTDWQCEDPSQCSSGQKCCGIGTVVVNPDPNCANYATGFKGTHCASSCPSGEVVMCTSSAQCGAGTCVPFGAKGNQVGACQ